MTPTTLVGLSFFLAVVNAVSPSPFYSFSLQPRIRPNSNLTFVLTTRNSSPSASYRLSFDILNRENNQTIASVDSKNVPPGGRNVKQTISLAIPRDVSLGPFALRTRSFRLNHTHAPQLVTETLHTLQLDLTNSTILIHLNKKARQFLQGDFVEFSVLVLDKQRQPFLETKKVDISIWKTRPEQFLIRRFPQVSIHPDKPFLTGQFQIPQTFYKNPNTKETFQILVTLDERSPDDPSILQGLTVHQSDQELIVAPLEESVFYSHGLIEISTLRKNRFQQKCLGVSVTFKNPFVTLDDPQVDMEVKVTNPLGLPSTSGQCTFEDSHSYLMHHCFSRLSHMVNFTQGVLSTRLNLSGTFDPDCLRAKGFLSRKSAAVHLQVTCTDIQYQKSSSYHIRNKVFVSAGSFLVSHVAVNYPEEPSLIFRITGKDNLPPGSEVTAGSSLQVTYVFHNGSQVTVNESIIEGGFAEHVLRDLVNHHDLSHLTAAFKDSGPVQINKCYGCPQKVETLRSPAMWLTHSNSKRIVAGKSAEVTVVSTSPVTNFHLRFTNRLGMQWETLEPVTPSKIISRLPFVTFVNLTFPPEITKVEFIDGHNFRLKLDVEVAAPVEINNAGNSLLLLTPPKTAGSLKVFGIFAQSHSAAGLPHLSKDPKAFGLCEIISPGAKPSKYKISCDISGPVGITPRRHETSGPISDVEITGKGAEDIPAHLHFHDAPGELQNGWLWTSASTHSDSLSIRTSLPSNVTHPQDFYGVLIDDLHGYRVTQPTTFDPKSPFDLFIRPPDKTADDEILRFTLFNNSNKTLSNVTLSQRDLNKRIVFQGTQGDFSFTSNTTLRFEIPPFTHKHFNTSFRSHKPGVVNFRAVASVNNVHSAVQTEFFINPTPNDFIASFDVLINNVNQTESSFSLSIPTIQQLKPNTSYHVDASASFNFLPMPFIRYFKTAIRRPNFAVVAGLLPLYASLGMLTPSSQRLLEDFVTSKLSTLNVSDLNPLSNHPPTILQSLLNLNDFQPGIVDLTTLSDLTQFVLHNHFPIQSTQSQAKVCLTKLDIYGQLDFFSNTQTILALHAALNHSDLIFPHNSSLKQQISSAIAEGTNVILDVTSNSSASHLAILATTRLLQLIGHPRAPEFFNRAAPIISQIMKGSKTRRIGSCREPHILQQSEKSLALLIHSTRGNLKQAYTLAKGLKALTKSTLDETYIIPNALTAFAKLARSAQFSTNRISVHPQPNYWQVGDELHLNIRGTGIGLAKIYFSQVNEIPT